MYQYLYLTLQMCLNEILRFGSVPGRRSCLQGEGSCRTFHSVGWKGWEDCGWYLKWWHPCGAGKNVVFCTVILLWCYCVNADSAFTILSFCCFIFPHFTTSAYFVAFSHSYTKTFIWRWVLWLLGCVTFRLFTTWITNNFPVKINWNFFSWNQWFSLKSALVYWL